MGRRTSAAGCNLLSRVCRLLLVYIHETYDGANLSKSLRNSATDAARGARDYRNLTVEAEAVCLFLVAAQREIRFVHRNEVFLSEPLKHRKHGSSRFLSYQS